MLGDRDYMRHDWRGGYRRQPFSSWSLTAKLLVVLSVIWLVQLLSQGWLTGLLALSREALRQGAYWTPLTAVFAHGGLFHLLFNGIGLWFFGRQVEEVLGRRHYLALFLLSGLAGNALWLAANWQHPLHSVVGASGALMGIAGAAAIYFPRQPVHLLFPPVTMRLRTLVICYAILDLFFEYTQISTGVGHLAHLGGLALGLLYAWWLRRVPRTGHFHLNDLWQHWVPRRGRPARTTTPGYRPPDLRWITPEPKPARDALADMNEEEAMAHIDEILDKISRDGLKSLTARERQLLERAGDKIKRSP